MAPPDPKSENETVENYTLVRAATGKMYMVSETEKPLPVTDEQQDKARGIIEDCEDKLSGLFGFSHGSPVKLHVGVPTVFVEHKRPRGEREKP